MRKLIPIFLGIMIIMSMSIVSFAVTSPVSIDLNGETLTMVDENSQDVYDYTLYVTGDFLSIDQDLGSVNILINQIFNSSSFYYGFGDPYLMGLYRTNGTTPAGTSDITFTINPQIKGFNVNTDYTLLAYNNSQNIQEWEIVQSQIIDNKIVATITGNGAEDFALIVDKDTLSADAAEPIKSGNEVLYRDFTGLDSNDIEFDGMITYFNNEEDIAWIDNIFTSLIDTDLFYNMIHAQDSVVEKGNLVLLSKTRVLIGENEFSEDDIPLTVTFYDTDIKEGMKVFVFHDKGIEENDWELVPGTVSDGAVTCQFNSLSPVVIYVEKIPEVIEPIVPEAPVTGDSSLIYVMMLGMLTIVGFALVAKKETK